MIMIKKVVKALMSMLKSKPSVKASRSETSKCRLALAKYCIGNGLDIGFGGDPIKPDSIAMDLPDSYAKYQDNPQHLHGQADNLFWFCDEVLDYVYSSHVLEDFPDTPKVLKEWLRIIKPGGRLVLYLPDEQTYREHCHSQGKPPNPYHIHANFSLAYVKALLPSHGIEVEHERFPVGIYSFELVLRKISV